MSKTKLEQAIAWAEACAPEHPHLYTLLAAVDRVADLRTLLAAAKRAQKPEAPVVKWRTMADGAREAFVNVPVRQSMRVWPSRTHDDWCWHVSMTHNGRAKTETEAKAAAEAALAKLTGGGK